MVFWCFFYLDVWSDFRHGPVNQFFFSTQRRRRRPAIAPPPIPPTGFTVEAVPRGNLGAALVGMTVHNWRPDDGWQRGTVARLCPRGALHVVAYNRKTSVLRGTADTLLDAASYCSRWVLLTPAPGAGVAQALRPLASRPYV